MEPISLRTPLALLLSSLCMIAGRLVVARHADHACARADRSQCQAAMRFLCAVPRHADAADSDHAYCAEQIAQDLAQLAKITDCVRTYSIENGLDQVPALAAKVGLKVIQGIWLSSNRIKNLSQISIAVGLSQGISRHHHRAGRRQRGAAARRDDDRRSRGQYPFGQGAGHRARHLCRCLGILAAQPRGL